MVGFPVKLGRGICFRSFSLFFLPGFFFFFFFFFFFRFWLLGFLAFRLLGFSASGLLGFSAFCWFMRLMVAFWLFASSAFPVPLRQVAFWLLRLFRWFMRLLAAFGGISFGLFGF